METEDLQERGEAVDDTDAAEMDTLRRLIRLLLTMARLVMEMVSHTVADIHSEKEKAVHSDPEHHPVIDVLSVSEMASHTVMDIHSEREKEKVVYSDPEPHPVIDVL
jgi:hypothetical protein